MDINPTVPENTVPVSAGVPPVSSDVAPDPLTFTAPPTNPTPVPTPFVTTQPMNPSPEIPDTPDTPTFDSYKPPEDSNSVVPIPVVRVLSPRGVEYVFLTLALLTAQVGLGAAIISLVNGQTSFSVLAYPTAALIVSVPIFAVLFLRLKKSELNNPDFKLDPSKRRSTQFTQIINFIVCFFALIGFVSALFAKMAGNYGGSIIKLFLDILVILVVSGGVLFYYWRDEHRSS
jgi:hypothetical protein